MQACGKGNTQNVALRRSFIHQDVLHRHRACWVLSEIRVARVRVHPSIMGNGKQGFFFTKNTFPLLCFVSYHLLGVCVVVFNHLSHCERSKFTISVAQSPNFPTVHCYCLPTPWWHSLSDSCLEPASVLWSATST